MAQSPDTSPSYGASVVQRRETFGVLLILCLANFARAGDSPLNTELLQLAASVHQANVDALLTWSGQVRVTTRMQPLPGGGSHPVMAPSANLAVDSVAKVDFACDRKRQATRWTWADRKGPRSDDPRTGPAQVTGLIPPVRNGMIKDGNFYFSAPIKSTPDPHPRRFMIGSPDIVRRRAVAPDFDPMYWFTARGEDLPERFRFFARMAEQGEELSHVSVRRDRDYVIFEINQGPALNRYTVDLAQGGLFSTYEGVGPGVTERWNYRNTRVAGVWVPEAITYQIVRVTTGRWVALELEWLENRVNDPLAPAEFSLIRLGARRGDTITDIRSKTSYTITGDEAPSPTKAMPDDNPPPTPYSILHDKWQAERDLLKQASDPSQPQELDDSLLIDQAAKN